MVRTSRRRVSDRDAVLRAVPERDFLALIIEAARWMGWYVFHDMDSRQNEAGYPDLTMVHPLQHRIIFAELKRETGRMRPEQLAWIGALMMVPGVEVHTWRPRDIDRVLALLQARTERDGNHD